MIPVDKRAAIEANRQRYETLRAAGQGETSQALPELSPPNPAVLPDRDVIHREKVPGGWYWTTRMNRGDVLRLLNVEGSATVSVIAWRRDDPSERINIADTVKVQWSSALRKGRMVLSDMGRVIFSIVEDSAGAHDALVGGSNAATASPSVEGPARNTRDNFVAAVGKLGLNKRDIPLCVAFFAPVSVGSDGAFAWNSERRRPGDYVELRAEMDLLVALSNCRHPLDPDRAKAPGPVKVTRFRRQPSADGDPCRDAGAEAGRAFVYTDMLTR